MEYTYKNWMLEKFEYNDKNKKLVPPEEQKSIEQEQKKIFTNLWQTRLDKYKKQFESNLENSEEKENCYNNEFNYLNNLLSNTNRNGLSMLYSFVVPNDIPLADRETIKRIIQEQIVGGRVYFSDIITPNKEFYESDMALFVVELNFELRILAFALYHFRKYLESIKASFYPLGKKVVKNREVPIWSEKYEEELKNLWKLLSENNYIDKINFQLFQSHFLGSKKDTLIHWNVTLPELIYLFDNLKTEYYDGKAFYQDKIKPSLITQHFYYTDRKGEKNSIRPNDLSKIRSAGKSPKNESLLKKIIASI